MPFSADLQSRLEHLIRASNALGSDRPLPEVLQWTADLAAHLLGARYAAIGMLGPDNQTLESFTTSGIEEEERARIGALPSGRGVLGVVIREELPLRLRSLRDHPGSVGFPAHHPPMKSFLGVPVVGRSGVLGNLYLTDKVGADEFSAEDEHLAVLLAGKAASAVEDARRHHETQRLMHEVQTLLRSRERFFAMVNHELRNSLAAVFGWAEMLVRRKDPSTVPRAAFEVVEAAESTIALINDLLDLSRLDEDRLRPVIEAVDCRPVIRRAIAKVTPAARERSVSLSVSPQEG
ncbi:MAG: GAF domain-containing sensor histidine kinase, partial [Gemmatimonadota bacterium]